MTRTPTYLIVEDDAGCARTLQRLLSKQGIESILASTGAAALTEIAAEKYEAVLLDLTLPDADGLSILNAIRATDRQTPVAVITGDDSGATAAKCIAYDVCSYVIKPFEPEEISALVATASRRLQAARRRATDLFLAHGHTGRERIVDKYGKPTAWRYRPLSQLLVERDLTCDTKRFREFHRQYESVIAQELFRERARARHVVAVPARLVMGNHFKDSPLWRMAKRLQLELDLSSAPWDLAALFARLDALRKAGFEISVGYDRRAIAIASNSQGRIVGISFHPSAADDVASEVRQLTDAEGLQLRAHDIRSGADLAWAERCAPASYCGSYLNEFAGGILPRGNSLPATSSDTPTARPTSGNFVGLAKLASPLLAEPDSNAPAKGSTPAAREEVTAKIKIASLNLEHEVQSLASWSAEQAEATRRAPTADYLHRFAAVDAYAEVARHLQKEPRGCSCPASFADVLSIPYFLLCGLY